ncbi:MAG: acyltransferase [Candidatus Eisenbacteria bacterium]|nr:acyltransferase [Candidatus Eisenbacteria bacterium]
MEETVKQKLPHFRGALVELFARIRWKLLMMMPNEGRIRVLRQHGVRIGEDCLIYTTLFSTEPYLVEIGDHVAISSGTSFVTHDASGWVFREHPKMDVFGRIHVGNNTFFGTSCTVLPGTQIGSNCIIGSGSVVRGVIPDDSVVFGNPARVIMKTSLMKQLLVNHKHRLDTKYLPAKDKEKVLRRHFGLPETGSRGE